MFSEAGDCIDAPLLPVPLPIVFLQKEYWDPLGTLIPSLVCVANCLEFTVTI